MPKASLLMLLLCSALMGCETVQYYSHVSWGQLNTVWGRQPIDELLTDETTSKPLHQRLASITQMRDFSISQLYLADNNSYRYYKDLQRPYAVWNVFAAPELSIEAKQWCFMVAGCVSYRGYFNQTLAEQYAQQLDEAGFDVYVAGVAAYSTLGWFDDPVLNTFVQRSDVQLAALLFHELAHQQLYLPGDTAFSESFAKTVEIEGVKLWLASRGKSVLLDGYLHKQAMADDFSVGLMALRTQLANLYTQPLNHKAMWANKKQLINHYQEVDYASFKLRWRSDRYDGWVLTNLNNAKLVTINSYGQWLPAFQALFHKLNGDWQRFYDHAKQLSALPLAEREHELNGLLK